MKTIRYQPRQVRLFLAILLALLAFLTLRLTRGAAPSARIAWLAAEAAVIGILMGFPRVFFPVYRVILTASGALGSAIFALLSILVFFLVLTPIALLMRLAGKRFVKARPDPSLASYYEEADGPGDVHKQF
ncbi:MAG: hypothetical protein JXO51_07935 [Candidatus Aminicenantes bacterium]|nr:hypothetical protein [Candidatus Aminicenantes bacterium]